MSSKIVNVCGKRSKTCSYLEEYIIPNGKTQIQVGGRVTDKTPYQKASK